MIYLGLFFLSLTLAARLTAPVLAPAVVRRRGR
jgi:hypothetical protein